MQDQIHSHSFDNPFVHRVPDGNDGNVLMTNFFDELAKGRAKSDAMPQANLQVIEGRQTRHDAAHPFYWGAFGISGSDNSNVISQARCLVERRNCTCLSMFPTDLFAKRHFTSVCINFAGFSA